MIPSLPTQITFLGVGQMSSAILKKLTQIKTVQYNLYDPYPSDVYNELCKSENVTGFKTSEEAILKSDMVVVGVKPHHVKDVLTSLTFKDQLIVSIAAGINTGSLKKWANCEVARVMPNTPALLGLGTFVIYCHSTNKQYLEWTNWMCKAVSLVVKQIDNEDLMDAVTALSGSGPAYLFYLAELMVKTGVEMGLDEETSRALTTGTLQGSAQMLSLNDPGTLRKQVTSPNGTTHAAIESFQQDGLEKLISSGIKKAQLRGEVLGKEFAKL